MEHEGEIGKECETKRENNKRVTKVKIKEKGENRKEKCDGREWSKEKKVDI